MNNFNLNLINDNVYAKGKKSFKFQTTIRLKNDSDKTCDNFQSQMEKSLNLRGWWKKFNLNLFPKIIQTQSIIAIKKKSEKANIINISKKIHFNVMELSAKFEKRIPDSIFGYLL